MLFLKQNFTLKLLIAFKIVVSPKGESRFSPKKFYYINHKTTYLMNQRAFQFATTEGTACQKDNRQDCWQTIAQLPSLVFMASFESLFAKQNCSSD